MIEIVLLNNQRTLFNTLNRKKNKTKHSKTVNLKEITRNSQWKNQWKTKEERKWSSKAGGEVTETFYEPDFTFLSGALGCFIESCQTENENNALHFVSLPRPTWEARLKYTKVVQEILQYSDLFRLFKQAIEFESFGCMGARYGVSETARSLTHIDTNILFLFGVSQIFSKSVENFKSNVTLKDIVIIREYFDFGDSFVVE